PRQRSFGEIAIGPRVAVDHLGPGCQIGMQPGACLFPPAGAVRLSQGAPVFRLATAGQCSSGGGLAAGVDMQVISKLWIRRKSIGIESGHSEVQILKPADSDERKTLDIVARPVLAVQKLREARENQGLGLATEHMPNPLIAADRLSQAPIKT